MDAAIEAESRKPTLENSWWNLLEVDSMIIGNMDGFEITIQNVYEGIPDGTQEEREEAVYERYFRHAYSETERRYKVRKAETPVDP